MTRDCGQYRDDQRLRTQYRDDQRLRTVQGMTRDCGHSTGDDQRLQTGNDQRLRTQYR
ncbi:unnamed protein product, partial [Staurois parvus]